MPRTRRKTKTPVRRKAPVNPAGIGGGLGPSSANPHGTGGKPAPTATGQGPPHNVHVTYPSGETHTVSPGSSVTTTPASSSSSSSSAHAAAPKHHTPAFTPSKTKPLSQTLEQTAKKVAKEVATHAVKAKLPEPDAVKVTTKAVQAVKAIAPKIAQLPVQRDAERQADDYLTKPAKQIQRAVVRPQKKIVARKLKVAVKRAKPKIKGPLTEGQRVFGETLAKKTGLSPRVVGAWELAENSDANAVAKDKSGYHNWLNIGPFDQDPRFDSPKTAAKATAAFLKGKDSAPLGGAGGDIPSTILPSAGKPDSQQMRAIENSDWSATGYGAGGTLNGTYAQVDGSAGKQVPAKLKVRAKQVLGPAKTRQVIAKASAPKTKGLDLLPKSERSTVQALAGGSKSARKKAEAELGKPAVAALLKGGQIVKAPKAGKDGLLKGRYAGSKTLVQEIVGTKVRGDHVGTKHGEAVGVHAADGDHSRPDGYAQDINGDNPSEHEPPFTQATMDKIVANLRKMGADVPDQTIGGPGWTGDVGGYTVYIEGGVTDHIHVGAHPSDSGGTVQPTGVKIKGTNLMVVQPTPAAATAVGSSAAAVGSTGTTTASGTPDSPTQKKAKRRRPFRAPPQIGSSSQPYYSLDEPAATSFDDIKADEFLKRLAALT